MHKTIVKISVPLLLAAILFCLHLYSQSASISSMPTEVLVSNTDFIFARHYEHGYSRRSLASPTLKVNEAIYIPVEGIWEAFYMQMSIDATAGKVQLSLDDVENGHSERFFRIKDKSIVKFGGISKNPYGPSFYGDNITMFTLDMLVEAESVAGVRCSGTFEFDSSRFLPLISNEEMVIIWDENWTTGLWAGGPIEERPAPYSTLRIHEMELPFEFEDTAEISSYELYLKDNPLPLKMLEYKEVLYIGITEAAGYLGYTLNWDEAITGWILQRVRLSSRGEFIFP